MDWPVNYYIFFGGKAGVSTCKYVELMLSLLQWMKEMWRSDSCYGNYGVDGSTCSFFIYLSEVSTQCVCLVCGSHVIVFVCNMLLFRLVVKLKSI